MNVNIPKERYIIFTFISVQAIMQLRKAFYKGLFLVDLWGTTDGSLQDKLESLSLPKH